MEPISCSCSAWRRVRAPALFIEFRLDMRCGEMQWVAWRRFSEFARLRRSLGRRYPAARKPLPGRNLKRHTTEPEDLKKRAPALAAWLCTVLQAEGAMSEVVVLEFVGLAASLPSTSRPPVHVSVLPAVAETGDLMLFRTKAAVPALQRAVTRSDWDHVGLVMHLDWRGRVCGSQSSAECGFIECDASGTHFYGLQQCTPAFRGSQPRTTRTAVVVQRRSGRSRLWAPRRDRRVLQVAPAVRADGAAAAGQKR